MKKILSAILLASTLAYSSAALAHSEWYGKEGQDEKPSYMEDAICKLPKQKAADFRATMKETQEENKDMKEQVYRLHGDLHAILTAPDFDKRAFLAKRQEIQKLYDEMEENRADAFASAVSQLSQKERLTLTRALHHDHVKHNKHHAQMQNGRVPAAGEPNMSIQH